MCFRLSKALLCTSIFLKIKGSEFTTIFTLFINFLNFTTCNWNIWTLIFIVDKWDNLVHLPYTNLIYCTQYSEIHYLWILLIKKEQKFYKLPIHIKLNLRYIEKCILNKYLSALEKGGCSVWLLAKRVTNMTADISASATKCYRGVGQICVKWERWDINSELNVGRVFNSLTQVISGFICKRLH